MNSQFTRNKELKLTDFRGGLRNKKDVKNEECSQWFIENKGAKKVLPMS